MSAREMTGARAAVAVELTGTDLTELRDLIERAKSAPLAQAARMLGKVIKATRPTKERPPRKPKRPALPGDDVFTTQQKRLRAYAVRIVRDVSAVWRLTLIRKELALTSVEQAEWMELGWPNRAALVSLDRDEPEVLQAAIDIVGGLAADAVNATL